MAYLNMDSAVKGNHSFRPSGVPMMYDTLYTVAKEVLVFLISLWTLGFRTIFVILLKMFIYHFVKVNTSKVHSVYG